MRLTEKETIQYLRDAPDQYAPLRISCLEPRASSAEGYQADAIIEFSIQDGPSFEAIVEIAPVATPQNILKKALQLADYLDGTRKGDRVPMVIAPYIGARQAKTLADRGISWMDLSGNMSIRVSNQIYIERTGNKNRFPDTAPIKKVFQGTSSLVSRALLLKQRGFSSLYDIVDFVNARRASITIPTVSKVLKSLDEELLIDRSRSLISVLDREKLLGKLTEGYMASAERKRRRTYMFATESPERLFRDLYPIVQLEYVACGIYAAQIKGLAVTDQVAIFVRNMEELRKAAGNNWLDITPDAQFGNLSITETNDAGPWFNASSPGHNRAAVVDDLELYLEMMAETPRGPKIAETLQQRILGDRESDG